LTAVVSAHLFACVGTEESGSTCEAVADDPLDGGFFPSPDCVDVERERPPEAAEVELSPCAACTDPCPDAPVPPPAGASDGGGTSGAGGSSGAAGGTSGGGGNSGAAAGTSGGAGSGGAAPPDGAIDDAHTPIPGIDPPAVAGQLVVTEAMGDPGVIGDSDGEWVELYNPHPENSLNLYGCELGDDDGPECAIDTDLVIEPGGYLVLAGSDAPGFAPDFVCGSLSLRNSSDDQAIVICNGVEIDRVSFSGAKKNRSASLDPESLDAQLNDDPAAWCDGSGSYNGDDLGTPGEANPACEPDVVGSQGDAGR
jgi:hypothetical protein